MYKAILFDLDGTLINTDRMNMETLRQLIKEELNIELTYDQVLKYKPYPGRKTIELAGFDDIEHYYAKWVEKVNAFKEGATLYPGVEQMIIQLQQQGYRLAIVSAKLKKQYTIDFEHQAIAKLFEVVVLAEDTSLHKPNPEPILLAMKRLGVAEDECLYVGDTIIDEQASMNAHLDFILAGWGSQDHHHVKTNKIMVEPNEIFSLLNR